MNFRLLILSIIFGMLLVLEDFNDSLTISPNVGNLDQILGHTLYHPIEILYPLGSIVVFLQFGWSCYKDGRITFASNKKMNLQSGRFYLGIIVFLSYFFLLALDDLDDISKILSLNIHFSLSYWYSVEALYLLGSIILFILFGKICFELGHPNSRSGK